MNTHDLKILPEYFSFVVSGQKNFEIRKNDRDFQVGDLLHLKEWNKDEQCYTGCSVMRKVVYISDFEQKDGYVVLGIEEVKDGEYFTKH